MAVLRLSSDLNIVGGWTGRSTMFRPSGLLIMTCLAASKACPTFGIASPRCWLCFGSAVADLRPFASLASVPGSWARNREASPDTLTLSSTPHLRCRMQASAAHQIPGRWSACFAQSSGGRFEVIAVGPEVVLEFRGRNVHHLGQGRLLVLPRRPHGSSQGRRRRGQGENRRSAKCKNENPKLLI